MDPKSEKDEESSTERKDDLVKKHPLLASALFKNGTADVPRKRSIDTDTDGSTDDDADEHVSAKKKAKKDKNTRRNIRKIKEDTELEKATIEARKEEEERVQRKIERLKTAQGLRWAQIEQQREKQQKVNVIVIDSDEDESANRAAEKDDSDDSDVVCIGSDIEECEIEDTANSGLHTGDNFNHIDDQGRVLINTDHPEDEPDIYLARQIVKRIKPHQIGGIRFLYDNVIESINRAKISEGYGCVLAHAMGLGKTLQVISFVDVFLRYTGHLHVLIIVPVNTIQTWKSEFNQWLPDTPNGFEATSPDKDEIDYRTLPLFGIDETTKNQEQRSVIIQQWKCNGGILVMGYETFRILVTRKRNHVETDRERGLNEALLDPGPQLVICDEGHRVKNENAQLSRALSRIRTKRRVILTGTPLQNNLLEYWTMVDFVRPRLLGSKNEFQNMFVAPITNGQTKDATTEDRRQMRFRSHVLHTLLKHCVQRRSHRVLHNDLPSKMEFIVLVRLSPQQIPYYSSFTRLSNESSEEGTMNAVVAYATCAKIWNHPDLLYHAATRGTNVLDDAEIFDDEFDGENGTSKRKKKVVKTSESIEWAKSCGIKDNYTPGNPEAGYKIPILLKILKKSAEKGEKLICFSQSLGTLDCIGKFIRESTDLPCDNWAKRIWRIDGSSGSLERERIINDFTAFDGPAILLISTRAGCVGINVTAATRVVMFDVSWNPVHDAQAVCRIYRIGQDKPCFIYRLVADGCMERAIYERQVAKTSLSRRIVDEKNIDRLSVDSNRALMIFKDQTNLPCPDPIEDVGDSIIEEISRNFGQYLSTTPLKMESLMVESKQQLTASEKRQAKAQYDSDKRNGVPCTSRGRPKLGFERNEQKPTAHVRPMPHVPSILNHPSHRGVSFPMGRGGESNLFPHNLAPNPYQNQLSLFENQFPQSNGSTAFTPSNYLSSSSSTGETLNSLLASSMYPSSNPLIPHQPSSTLSSTSERDFLASFPTNAGKGGGVPGGSATNQATGLQGLSQFANNFPFAPSTSTTNATNTATTTSPIDSASIQKIMSYLCNETPPATQPTFFTTPAIAPPPSSTPPVRDPIQIDSD